MSMPTTEKLHDGEIVLHVQDGRVTHAWARRGLQHLRVIEGRAVNTMTVDDFRVLAPGDLRQLCSRCGGPLPASPFQHLAGYYCDSCAEDYKAHHAGQCLLCHQPRWACHC